MELSFLSQVPGQTILFVLSVWVISGVIKRLLDPYLAGHKKWWDEHGVQTLPIWLGIMMALLGKPELPFGLPMTKMGYIVYGSVCGSFSEWLYSRVRRVLKAKSSKADTKSDSVSS
jgi:uncharacterized membrane protein YdjX (TVP38/TMEM64 family)